MALSQTTMGILTDLGFSSLEEVFEEERLSEEDRDHSVSRKRREAVGNLINGMCGGDPGKMVLTQVHMLIESVIVCSESLTAFRTTLTVIRALIDHHEKKTIEFPAPWWIKS